MKSRQNAYGIVWKYGYSIFQQSWLLAVTALFVELCEDKTKVAVEVVAGVM